MNGDGKGNQLDRNRFIMGHSLFICDSAHDDTESVGIGAGINNQRAILSEIINCSLIERRRRTVSKCLFYQWFNFTQRFLSIWLKNKR